MHRLALGVVLLLSLGAIAQSPASDPQAVSLAQQSMVALTGGNPVSDVTVNANVISMPGSDQETGTATLYAKGASESRVDLSLASGTRSDVRNAANGLPSGAWARNGNASTAYASHNCWIDATWFFPALSSLSQYSNAGYVFQYVGAEQYLGVSTQHIRVFQNLPQDRRGILQSLSTMDFYLDATSNLPVAASFNLHGDTDAHTNIAQEIRFSNYQLANGIPVPFHIQRLVDGNVALDFTITNTALNSGIPDSQFTLP